MLVERKREKGEGNKNKAEYNNFDSYFLSDAFKPFSSGTNSLCFTLKLLLKNLFFHL